MYCIIEISLSLIQFLCLSVGWISFMNLEGYAFDIDRNSICNKATMLHRKNSLLFTVQNMKSENLIFQPMFTEFIHCIYNIVENKKKT